MPRLARRRLQLACGVGLSLLDSGPPAADGGPPLLLLHGFPELADSWRQVIERLRPARRCLAPDLRGYGASDRPRGLRHYRPARMVADVRELIDGAADGGPVDLVGHDAGGAVAWAAAAALPRRVRRLVVINCPHPRVLARRLATSPRQLLRSWHLLAVQLPWLPERLIARHGERLLRWLLADAQLSPAQLAPYRAQAADGLRGGLDWFRAATRATPWPRQRIRQPTTLLWGERDPFLGPALADPQRYRGLVERLHVHRWPDVGHWGPLTHPDAVAHQLQRGLASDPDAAP